MVPLRVIDPQGKSHRVLERAAKMIVSILVRADKINAGRSGSLTFSFDARGNALKVRWIEDSDWELI